MTDKSANIDDTAKLPMATWEFVTLMASLLALNALAIDIMLPGLGDIGESFALHNANDQQAIIFAYILGFGVPQLFFGPLSDRFGRKALLQIGLLGYIAMSVTCIFASSFSVFLVMRFSQGVFAACIRVIAGSIVRDLMSGREMARVMSTVMTVFMIAPIVAPTIGVITMNFGPWQWIFLVLAIAAMIVLLWMTFRLPETLPTSQRRAINIGSILKAYWTVLTTRVTIGYMCASGVIYGSLFAFIGASEQIFTDVFDEGERFVIWFAVIAASLAVANIINARIVKRIGMRRISHTVICVFIGLCVLNALLMAFVGEILWIFLPLFAITFGCFGMMGANFSAIAMEPQGEISGTATAAYGFATSTVASFFGISVARQFDGTIAPIMLGFVVLGVLCLVIVYITEKGRLFEVGAGHK
ncbi:MAG: multidrug effflux MFS transporter [Maricaulaceae bacterium]